MTPSPDLAALLAQRIVVTVHPSLRDVVEALEQDAATARAAEQALDALDRAFHPAMQMWKR